MTIRKVAQKAGVSIGTVSRALNHKPGVSDKTRQHVFTVAQELGYTSPTRLPLPTSRVTHLGLLSRPMGNGPLTANPFYGDVFYGIEQACHEFRINLSFSTLNVVDGQRRSMPALIGDSRIGGVVLVGALSHKVVGSAVTSLQLPVVPWWTTVSRIVPGTR